MYLLTLYFIYHNIYKIIYTFINLYDIYFKLTIHIHITYIHYKIYMTSVLYHLALF